MPTHPSHRLRLKQIAVVGERALNLLILLPHRDEEIKHRRAALLFKARCDDVLAFFPAAYCQIK